MIPSANEVHVEMLKLEMVHAIEREQLRRKAMEAMAFQKLAEEFKKWRQANGISQGELARRIGTTQSVVSRFERGHVGNVTWNFLVRMSRGIEQGQADTVS